MPCTDVTEVLRLKLDNDDRITGYSLNKLTCGGSVPGRSLIRKWVKHKSVSEVLNLNAELILQESNPKNSTEEYVYLKHLFAIQTAIETLKGNQTGSVGNTCVINSVNYDTDGLELIAELEVQMLTDKIKACGACSTCR